MDRQYRAVFGQHLDTSPQLSWYNVNSWSRGKQDRLDSDMSFFGSLLIGRWVILRKSRDHPT